MVLQKDKLRSKAVSEDCGMEAKPGLWLFCEYNFFITFA